MMMFNFIWRLLFTQGVLTCSSDYKSAPQPGTTTTQAPGSTWGGWSPSADKLAEWNKWLDLYKSQTKNNEIPFNQLDPAERKKLLEERGPGSGWPGTWADLGKGNGGDAPPPWGYVPKNTGKPSRCYLPPIKGGCEKSIQRWGYNPFVDECQGFVYSGCGGNKNNFKEKLDCEEICVAEAPPSECNFEIN